MAFDPYAPAPPELETGPITSPVPMDLKKLAIGAGAAMVAPAVAGPLLLGSMAAGGPGNLLNAAAGAPPPTVPAAASLPAGLPPAAPPPMAAPVAAPPMQMPARTAGRGGGARPTAPQVDAMGNEIKSAGSLAEQGAEELQGAKAAGAEEKAGLMGGMADLQEAQADERKATAERNSQLSKHLEEQDAANLKTARDKTIPDFWAGHKGAEVGSIISMALGGIASGILGGPNGAAQIIQKKTDDYFYREKEKIDNLYKYAEQTGKLNDKTRLRYAQELSDLGAQHLAVNQSILTRINQVEAKNQGAVDRAMITGLKANIEEATSKRLQDYRTTQQELANHTLTAQAGAAASRANAAESRAGAKLKLAQAASGGITGHAASGEMLKSQGFADTAISNDKVIQQTPMSPQGMQTIIQDMQREQMGEQHTGLRGIAQLAGQWKTIEQKLSPQDQRALLAARQFINADLRRESGAAISPQEFQSAFARYFPSVGDSPETIRQKAANRQQSIHSMRVAGGQDYGGQPVAVAAPLAPQADQSAQARAWAQANPNDPRSAQIFARLGR